MTSVSPEEYLSMSTFHLAPAERSNKTHSVILQRLAPVGTQTSIAATLGKSESFVTRLKAGLPEICVLLTACGLKVVDVDAECTRKDELAFLRRVYAKASEHAPHLLDDGE